MLEIFRICDAPTTILKDRSCGFAQITNLSIVVVLSWKLNIYMTSVLVHPLVVQAFVSWACLTTNDLTTCVFLHTQ